jgi:aromatic-L-amino-acid decarboxylase
MAAELAGKLDTHPDFELVAPVPFSVVCFRWKAGESEQDQDLLNQRLLEEINAQGPFFLSSTVLRGRFTLRVAIGNLRTTREHLTRVWEVVRAAADRLSS